MTKHSAACRWVLEAAHDGSRVIPSNGYEHHVSVATGEKWHGAPWRAHGKCRENGWLGPDDRITSAGKRALAEIRKSS